MKLTEAEIADCDPLDIEPSEPLDEMVLDLYKSQNFTPESIAIAYSIIAQISVGNVQEKWTKDYSDNLNKLLYEKQFNKDFLGYIK